MLGISRAQAYRLVASGEIPSVWLGRRRVVPLDQLDKLLQDKLLQGVAPSMPLREALERMRVELAEGGLRLQVERDHPPIVYPLHHRLQEIVERALRGQATRREVENFLAAIEQVRIIRAVHGDQRNAANRERWAGVLRELADTLKPDGSGGDG
jgi:excisionase family DNA binding protein